MEDAMEPEGPYLAILMVLEGLAEAGVADRSSIASIGDLLARKGRELNNQGYRVEGGELLRLADATASVYDRLPAAKRPPTA